MPLSISGRPDEPQAIRTIHAALDAGITLIDTADAYCLNGEETGHNERLIAKALRQWNGSGDSVLVATKGGHVRDSAGSWLVDGRPEHLRAACEASLAALGVDAIGLYQHHRPDPAVPYAESIGALRELQQEGKVRLVGISNADAGQIDDACATADIASVQNQLSPRFRSSEPELERCADLGVAFLPWSPLGGIGRASGLGDRHAPFREVARGRGVSPQQVCLAWMLAKAPVVIPIPGSSRPETILDSAGAADLDLTAEEMAALDGSERRPLRRETETKEDGRSLTRYSYDA